MIWAFSQALMAALKVTSSGCTSAASMTWKFFGKFSPQDAGLSPQDAWEMSYPLVTLVIEHSCGKSPFFMGNSLFQWPCSIAMLNYQSVIWVDPAPLKNLWLRWDDEIPKIWRKKTCSKPPNSNVSHHPTKGREAPTNIWSCPKSSKKGHWPSPAIPIKHIIPIIPIASHITHQLQHAPTSIEPPKSPVPHATRPPFPGHSGLHWRWWCSLPLAAAAWLQEVQEPVPIAFPSHMHWCRHWSWSHSPVEVELILISMSSFNAMPANFEMNPSSRGEWVHDVHDCLWSMGPRVSSTLGRRGNQKAARWFRDSRHSGMISVTASPRDSPSNKTNKLKHFSSLIV